MSDESTNVPEETAGEDAAQTEDRPGIDDQEGVGIGMDDEPNTFEPEEDPEATEPPE